jgi:hypothetical protein
MSEENAKGIDYVEGIPFIGPMFWFTRIEFPLLFIMLVSKYVCTYLCKQPVNECLKSRVTFNDRNNFQHIYYFMLVHLTVKFKYDGSKVNTNQISTKS